MKVIRLAAIGGLAFTAMSSAAMAQLGGGPGYYQGFTANAKGCPTIRYAFRGMSETPVGYVWFSDASGISKATGTADLKTGKFNLTLKSLDGTGPTGTVDGVKDPHTGIVTAVLKGPGCSNLTLQPMSPTMETPNG
jgi:hypothetical protein